MMHPEDNESLWSLGAPLLVWVVHFLASYVTAAIWCAKVESLDEPLTTVRIAIAIYTVVALVAVGALGWRGYRRNRAGGSTVPRDADAAAGRHRFLGFSAMLLSGLSAVAIVYSAMVPIFIGSCR
jgi:hypothetical protein